MAEFPKQFVDRVVPLEPGIGEKGDAALQRIHNKGFDVALGLTEYYAGAIGVMGYQRHIREYCPKDSDEARCGSETRFSSLATAAKWLQKGRCKFLLLKGVGADAQLEGYGWTGVGPCEQLPDHPITSAYRVGERVLKEYLGRDFTQVIVSGTHTLFTPEAGIGLETWESNRAAKSYLRLGFRLMAKAPELELRPTLDPNAEDGMVLDRRLYMAYYADF